MTVTELRRSVSFRDALAAQARCALSGRCPWGVPPQRRMLGNAMLAQLLEPKTGSQSTDDERLLERMLHGDESALVELVNHYHTTLVRLAATYVHDGAIGEEVAQDTWLGVLRGVHQFAGRSTLKTWIIRILINTAKRRAMRERHCIPFSAAWDAGSEPFEPAVAASRFRGPAAQWPGGWISFSSNLER